MQLWLLLLHSACVCPALPFLPLSHVPLELCELEHVRKVTLTVTPFGTGKGKAEEECQVTAQLNRPANAAQLPSLHEQSCCGV